MNPCPHDWTPTTNGHRCRRCGAMVTKAQFDAIWFGSSSKLPDCVVDAIRRHVAEHGKG